MFGPRGPGFFELARQALSSTERGYDLLAPKFDHTPFRTPDAILSSVARYLEREPRPERALDLCSGTGAMLSALSPICRRGAVGLDFSRGMLREARRKLPDAPLVRARAEMPPFHETFDLVTCSSALGHFRGRESELVAAVHRTLVPGGRFVFVTAPEPPPLSRSRLTATAFNAAMHVRNALWSPPFVMFYLTFLLDEARRRLERAGFDVTVAEEPLPSPWEGYSIVDARRVRSAATSVSSDSRVDTSARAAPRRLRRSAR